MLYAKQSVRIVLSNLVIYFFLTKNNNNSKKFFLNLRLNYKLPTFTKFPPRTREDVLPNKAFTVVAWPWPWERSFAVAVVGALLLASIACRLLSRGHA